MITCPDRPLSLELDGALPILPYSRWLTCCPCSIVRSLREGTVCFCFIGAPLPGKHDKLSVCFASKNYQDELKKWKFTFFENILQSLVVALSDNSFSLAFLYVYLMTPRLLENLMKTILREMQTNTFCFSFRSYLGYSDYYTPILDLVF